MGPKNGAKTFSNTAVLATFFQLFSVYQTIFMSRMVRFGQLSKNNCLKFVFNSPLGTVPAEYCDTFYRNILHLNEELEKLIGSETLYFWSSLVHNSQCQKVKIIIK